MGMTFDEIGECVAEVTEYNREMERAQQAAERRARDKSHEHS